MPSSTSAIRGSDWLLYYAPPVIWAAAIFTLSSQTVLPSLTVSAFDFVFKKVAHMFVYAVLYILIQRAVFKKKSPQTVLYWLLPMTLTLLYAITDEVHQAFVPGRYGTIRDIGYDLLGACIVFLRQYRYI